MTDPRIVNGVMRDVQRARTLDHFLTEWASSLKKAEKAEATYAAVVAEYRNSNDSAVIADVKASSDIRLTQAIGDCSYYQRRAITYGISALVELMRGSR